MDANRKTANKSGYDPCIRPTNKKGATANFKPRFIETASEQRYIQCHTNWGSLHSCKVVGRALTPSEDHRRAAYRWEPQALKGLKLIGGMQTSGTKEQL